MDGCNRLEIHFEICFEPKFLKRHTLHAKLRLKVLDREVAQFCLCLYSWIVFYCFVTYIVLREIILEHRVKGNCSVYKTIARVHGSCGTFWSKPVARLLMYIIDLAILICLSLINIQSNFQIRRTVLVSNRLEVSSGLNSHSLVVVFCI